MPKVRVKVEALPRVEVVWTDAYIDVEQEADFSKGDTKFGGLAVCEDVGYLVRKNRTEIVLAVSRTASDNTVRIANTIPAQWVKEIRYLDVREASSAKPKHRHPDARPSDPSAPDKPSS